MKKFLRYLSVILVIALVLTGCGKKEETKNKDKNNNSVENVSFDDAVKNTLEVKNFKYDASVNVSISLAGADYAKGVFSLNGEIDSKGNLHLYLKENMTAEGETEDIMGELYYDSSTKKIYSLEYENDNEKDENKWDVEEDMNVDTTQNIDPTKILENVKESKKIDSDKDGYDKYEVTIDTLKALNITGEEDLSLAVDTFKIPDLKVYAYVNGKYISNITFDLGELLKEPLGQLIFAFTTTSTTSNVNIPKFDLIFNGNIDLSNFGEVSEITIPENIKTIAETNSKVTSSEEIKSR